MRVGCEVYVHTNNRQRKKRNLLQIIEQRQRTYTHMHDYNSGILQQCLVD